jgi:hypothetical protein
VHLEIDEVGPVLYPGIEECAIVALHDLEALTEVVGHPAVHVLKPGRCEATAITKAAVDGQWVGVAKPLDDHEEHVRRWSGVWVTAVRPSVPWNRHFAAARAVSDSYVIREPKAPPCHPEEPQAPPVIPRSRRRRGIWHA